MTLEIPVKKQNKQLSELITQLKQEEEIILTQDGKPVARLVSIYRPPVKRVPGSAKGQITIMPGFDDPLPEEILSAFES